MGAAVRASGASPVSVPVVGARGTVVVGADMLPAVPIPVSGLIQEKNDVIVARGTAAAGTDSVGAADSFGAL